MFKTVHRYELFTNERTEKKEYFSLVQTLYVFNILKFSQI